MLSFLTNSNNDIFIDSSGNLAIGQNINALANVSKNKILTTLGEPQYNQLDGIPYFETIFCDTPKIDLFQASQIEALESLEHVNKVAKYDYTQENGVFNYVVTIDSDFGEIQLNG